MSGGGEKGGGGEVAETAYVVPRDGVLADAEQAAYRLASDLYSVRVEKGAGAGDDALRAFDRASQSWDGLRRAMGLFEPQAADGTGEIAAPPAYAPGLAAVRDLSRAYSESILALQALSRDFAVRPRREDRMVMIVLVMGSVARACNALSVELDRLHGVEDMEEALRRREET